VEANAKLRSSVKESKRKTKRAMMYGLCVCVAVTCGWVQRWEGGGGGGGR